MRVHSFGIILALGLAISGSSAFAAPLSGGASGGGAIEGGSGAPGGGVGIPGAIVGNLTAQGIGEDATFAPATSARAYLALATMPVAGVGSSHAGAVNHLYRRGALQTGF